MTNTLVGAGQVLEGLRWGRTGWWVFFLQGTITHYHNVSAQADGQPERSSCSRYELSLVQNLSASGLHPPAGNLSALESYGLEQESCVDGWIYSTEFYRSTVVTEVRREQRGPLKSQFTCFSIEKKKKPPSCLSHRNHQSLTCWMKLLQQSGRDHISASSCRTTADSLATKKKKKEGVEWTLYQFGGKWLAELHKRLSYDQSGS